MVIKNVSLDIVCGITSTLPDNEWPEVAFAGKSNVGKSSLINALMNRKALARTSSQPGKTQTINFYKITYKKGIKNKRSEYLSSPDMLMKDQKARMSQEDVLVSCNANDEMYLVDLPGYGYTKVAVSVKEKWGKMIERYLTSSKMLKAVFLLIDIRHLPSENDKQMYEWIIDNGYQPIIIATKLDKLKRSQVGKHVKQIKTRLDLVPDTPIIPFSAMSKQGREEIWEMIELFITMEA